MRKFTKEEIQGIEDELCGLYSRIYFGHTDEERKAARTAYNSKVAEVECTLGFHIKTNNGAGKPHCVIDRERRDGDGHAFSLAVGEVVTLPDGTIWG